MSTTVVLPWKPTRMRERLAALAWVLDAYWRRIDLEVRIGNDLGDGDFVKARAVAQGLRHARGDVLVLADADVWCDGLDDAIRAVEHGSPWAIPHRLVHRLDEHATTQVFAGARPADTGGRAQRAYPGTVGGGIVVLTRNLYERVPLDHRFEGWGQEDEAWGTALRTLAGKPARFGHPLYHLWHPPAARITRAQGNAEGVKLRRRYAAAHTDQARMAALVAEAREATSCDRIAS